MQKVTAAIFVCILILGSSAKAGDLGYRYTNGKCLNTKGQEGLNPAFLGECGNQEGAALDGKNLEGKILKGIDFKNASLKGASFKRADLTGANLTKASLKKAVFAHANLSAAILEFADLSASNFKAAILTDVRISAAILDAAFFSSSTKLPFSEEEALGLGMIRSPLEGLGLYANVNLLFQPSYDALKKYLEPTENYSSFDSVNDQITEIAQTKAIVFIPELRETFYKEAQDLFRKTIRDYVSNGGTLVLTYMYGESLAFFNGIFGFKVETSDDFASRDYGLNTEMAKGTAFEGGPDSVNRNHDVGGVFISTVINTLPAGSRAIYTYDNLSMLSVVPYGAGQIIYLGWDYYEGDPTDADDALWYKVLDRVIEE